MICINTPPWNSKLTLSKFGHFQVNHVGFRGCTSFHVPGTSVKELLWGHYEAKFPIKKQMVMKSLERSKSTRKFDHEITFNKGRSGVHFHKKVSSVFSPQFTWKGHKFQWKKKSPNNFLPPCFFFWFLVSPKILQISRTWRRKKAERKRRQGVARGWMNFSLDDP